MIWHSWWAFSFLLLLVLAALVHFFLRKKRHGTFPLSTFFIARGLDSTMRVKMRLLPDLLKYLGLALLVLALARPQKTDEKTRKEVEGIDIMLALDISHSMLIEDMKPENRMESAKKTIEEIYRKKNL